MDEAMTALDLEKYKAAVAGEARAAIRAYEAALQAVGLLEVGLLEVLAPMERNDSLRTNYVNRTREVVLGVLDVVAPIYPSMGEYLRDRFNEVERAFVGLDQL